MIRARAPKARHVAVADSSDRWPEEFLRHVIHGNYDRLDIPENLIWNEGMYVYDPDSKEFVDIDLE
jgi:hypothetical protein